MMTEDGASVDSVTGELATRLGAVGGVAGEAVRRSVRDAAGGAQTIARMVQADMAGARQFESADTAAAAAPGQAEPPAPTDRPAGTGAADHYLGSGDRPAPEPPPDSPAPAVNTEPSGDRPDPAQVPHAEARAHAAAGAAAGPTPDTAPGPKSPDTAAEPPPPSHPAVPVPTADEPARTTAALAPDPVADVAAASAGHTPWAAGPGAGAGAEQATGHSAGSTPWNSGSGSGSSMPYMPGMPGGLGSLTPQERPPRGSAPWSRGRENKDGTVFPRPRAEPDRPASTNRTEWAP